LFPLDLVPYKLNSFGLTSGYVSWFHSYLTSKQSSVYMSCTLSSLRLVNSRVPQGSTLGNLLFNNLTNNAHACVRVILFIIQTHLVAADLKVYHNINNIKKLLTSAVRFWSVQISCVENDTYLITCKTAVLSFMYKTSSIYFNRKLHNNLLSYSECK
jgi:hypothetical protein